MSLVAARIPEIQLENVEMRYVAETADVLALHQVSLDIAKGEFVSLLGPSGCGKTTLLRLMADLITPTGGNITVAGKSAKEARLAQKYGIVFQSPVLYDWRKVKHNITLPLELMGVKKSIREDKALELLDLVGLQGFADKYPGSSAAACSSGLRLPERCRWNRRYCSWMNRSPRWMSLPVSA